MAVSTFVHCCKSLIHVCLFPCLLTFSFYICVSSCSILNTHKTNTKFNEVIRWQIDCTKEIRSLVIWLITGIKSWTRNWPSNEMLSVFIIQLRQKFRPHYIVILKLNNNSWSTHTVEKEKLNGIRILFNKPFSVC